MAESEEARSGCRTELYQDDTENGWRPIQSIRVDRTSHNLSPGRLGRRLPLGVHRPKIRVVRKFAKAGVFSDGQGLLSWFPVHLFRTIFSDGRVTVPIILLSCGAVQSAPRDAVLRDGPTENDTSTDESGQSLYMLCAQGFWRWKLTYSTTLRNSPFTILPAD